MSPESKKASEVLPEDGLGSLRGCLVEGNADLQVGIAAVQRVVGKRLEAQLVRGIRGVRYELPQKYLLVPVEGVDHEVKQLLHLRLEPQGFLGRCRWHGHSGCIR